jgi:hypothetical protein
MGEAKRRRQAALDTFNRQVKDQHGNTEWLVLRARDIERLFANRADRRKALIPVLNRFLTQIYDPNTWPGGKAPLCIACPQTVGPLEAGHEWPAAFVLQLPWNWETSDTVAVVSTACPRCAHQSDEELIRIAANSAYGTDITVRKVTPS